MNSLIFISAFLVIFTKLADVLTTLKFLKSGNIALERNKLAGKLMSKFGPKSVVWGVFIIAVLVVIVATWQILTVNNIWYDWAFIVIAILVSLFQASVARYNYSGKANFLVELISRFRLYR
jgi:hypothetical protein